MKNRKVIIIAVIAVVLVLITTILVINNNYNKRDYTIEKVKDYNYFVLVENNQYGVIDKNGKKIIDTKYDNIKIPNPSKGVFIATQNSKNKVLNENGEEIFSKYELVDCIRLKNIASDLMYEKSVLTYSKDGKYGLIDYQGKELTGAIYNSISALEYKEGELIVEKDGKYGVININGNELVPIEYDQIDVDDYYRENEGYKKAGYIVGQKTDEGYRYGYIDVNGNKVTKVEYNEMERITDIQEDAIYLIASKNGQYGVLKNENEILKNEYQSITYDQENNVLVVEKSKKFGVSTLSGNIIISIKYSQINITGKYLYAEQKNAQTEVYDNEGKQINIDPNTSILSIEDGKYNIVITSSKNKTLYSVTDKDGKTIINNDYTYIKYLFDKYFMVCGKDGKLGVLDDEGKEVASLKYDSIQEIGSTNLVQASILSSNITYLYSNQMENICEMKNATIKQIDEFIEIYNNDEIKYFNKQGKEVSNKEVYGDNKLFSKAENGKWGFVDSSDNVKVEFKYDEVTEFNKYGYAGIKQNGKWGVIDIEGNIVVEPKYEFKDNERPDFLGEYYKVTYGFGEFYYTK